MKRGQLSVYSDHLFSFKKWRGPASRSITSDIRKCNVGHILIYVDIRCQYVQQRIFQKYKINVESSFML